MLDSEIIELTEKEDYVSEVIRYWLDDMVVWQEEAKTAIVDAISNGMNGITSKKWPLAVLFFYWPSGVGKTEIAHALAKTLLGDPNRITKVKCEQYQEAHTYFNLIGSPKWYIGSDQESILGKGIYKHIKEARKEKEASNIIARYQHFNIIVFDEIEKAHPKVHQALLGIMDDGNITLSNNQEIDFSESIIIMTSNIWESEKRELSSRKTIGFIKDDKESDKFSIMKEAFKLFSPEFLWRIDAKIEFQPLTKNDCKDIVRICVERLNEVLDIRSENNVTTKLILWIEDSVYDHIIERWFDSEKWARQLVREFNRVINAKLGKILSDNPAVYEFLNKEAKIIALMEEWQVKFELRKENIRDIRKNNVFPLLPKP